MERTPLENWISKKTGIPGRPELPILQTYQLLKLRETLEQVLLNSRFYRGRLQGIAPESIQSMADIARLPFTYPEDISERGIDFLCVSPRDIDRIVTLSTSGTTGSPKRIYFTREDQELTTDFFHHGMTTFTDASDKVMIFMPGSTEGSVGDLLKKSLARFNCTAVVYGPIKDYADAMSAMIKEKITSIVGIPSQILTLSRVVGDGTAPPIKSILLSADYVPLATATSLSAVWGATVYGHYGLTETGLGGGVECAAQTGYHLREADLLFEIVDPISGRPVPDGSYGEVVFSTLTRRGMPLIRYRTGDRSRFLTEPCPCGTVLRRLDRITGRLREAVKLSGGRTLSISELDELVLTDTTALGYAAELLTKDTHDVLHITVRPASQSFDRGQLEQRLQSGLNALFRGHHLRVEVSEGDTGFFTTGTAKRFIADNRNREQGTGKI